MFRQVVMAAAVFAVALAGAARAEAQQPAAEQSTETVLHEGVWIKKTAESKGGWKIVANGGDRYVVLGEDFSTRKAPDLKIFLSPLTADEANGENAVDGSVMIAPLASNKGAQRYAIPHTVDLAAFKSILIHCEQYSKLWSAADL